MWKRNRKQRYIRIRKRNHNSYRKIIRKWERIRKLKRRPNRKGNQNRNRNRNRKRRRQHRNRKRNRNRNWEGSESGSQTETTPESEPELYSELERDTETETYTASETVCNGNEDKNAWNCVLALFYLPYRAIIYASESSHLVLYLAPSCCLGTVQMENRAISGRPRERKNGAKARASRRR